jgi:hypothetical protein
MPLNNSNERRRYPLRVGGPPLLTDRQGGKEDTETHCQKFAPHKVKDLQTAGKA